MTLSWSGANFGGVTITHAPRTAGVELSARSLIVADTGPSETSSYQSSLAQKYPSRAVPRARPTCRSRPAPPGGSRASLRISPSGTVVDGALANLIVPVSNFWLSFGPVQGTLARVDLQVGGGFGVAAPRIRRLRIGQVHGPGDFRFGVGDFIDRSVVVVGEDAEPRGLTLDPALRVFEAAGRIWRLADPFRTDEELIGTVADPCDPDRRVNLVYGCHALPPRTRLRNYGVFVRYGQPPSPAVCLPPPYGGPPQHA